MLKQICAAIILIILSGCIQSPADSALKTTIISFSDSNFTINASIADTYKSRELGLMYISNLPKNDGMLFVYENERLLSFWMANTNVPLDIIFLDNNKKIVDIQKMQPCYEPIKKNCKNYISRKPASYAIEINQNLTDNYNISVGQIVTWN